MKIASALLLSGVCLTANAATLVLDYPAGLQSGTHSISCSYSYVYGGPSYFTSNGPNTSAMPQYGLLTAMNDLNEIINDNSMNGTTNISLNITLTCNNQKSITHHFKNDQLKAAGQIALAAPAGCA